MKKRIAFMLIATTILAIPVSLSAEEEIAVIIEAETETNETLETESNTETEESFIETIDSLPKLEIASSESVDEAATVASSSTVTIDSSNFPDATLRSYVLDNFDTDGDGELSSTEIEGAASLDIYQNVSNTAGIEYLTSLTYMSFIDCGFTSIDVSKNTALETLTIGQCNLNSIDISKNTSLKNLTLLENNLTSLDVSNNTKLINLDCSNNKLTSLDVSKNTKLEMLRCGNNSLSKLDISKNTSLLYLFCYQNSLTSLDVSNNTGLITLYCGDNKLTSLDVSKNTKLTTLTCYRNSLSGIDISKNTELVIFNCFSNAFSVLDVTNNTKIETMNLVDQTVAVTATYSDGYYRISLADLVGKDNISNVSVETAGVSISGNYLVYKNKLSSLVYNYTVKNATISKTMNVTLNITVGSSSASTVSLSRCKISSLTNVAKGIKIKWSQVSGASGYIIYRKTTTGSYSKIKTIKSGSTVSYTDKKIANQNGTVYTYKVIPYSGSTKGSGTEVTTARLTGISLTSVKNSAAGKAKVKWTAATNVGGYQIQYSTSSSFASSKKKTVSGASKSSKTLTGLAKGSTYYVRIRTYKTVNGTKYYSAWSSKLKVKITK